MARNTHKNLLHIVKGFFYTYKSNVKIMLKNCFSFVGSNIRHTFTVSN